MTSFLRKRHILASLEASRLRVAMPKNMIVETEK